VRDGEAGVEVHVEVEVVAARGYRAAWRGDRE